MILPMFLPVIYTSIYKKKALEEIIIITFLILFIIILYWPLTLSIRSTANIITKFILFVLIPLFILFMYEWRKNNYKNIFEKLGISNKGIKPSIKLGLLLIPIMLLVTYLILIITTYINNTINLELGITSFIESFTEEFFFRGILFLYLMSKTNLKIAYITSLSSFILMHPQNFSNLFIISTVVQGFLTTEISRRSKNLTGSWILHGTNRFFSIIILPLIA
jgi:membrane protease YdiL (CAAX protease family)